MKECSYYPLFEFDIIEEKDVIKNNQLNINKDQWNVLCCTMGKEEIKDFICDVIENNNLPLPYSIVTDEDRDKDFFKLRSLNTSSLFKDVNYFSRYEYKWPFTDRIITIKSTGSASSNYYHQDNRWKCGSIHSKSPYDVWTNREIRKTMLNALWSLKKESVDGVTLRSAIQMRKYIASQFRPSAAKALYDYFEAEHILDFSSGWGDRLSGFMASKAKSYFGVDPNTSLIDGYQKQKEKFGGRKKITMVCAGAEDIDYGDNKFDFIFTSPPYFNVEKYSDDDKQSYLMYANPSEWIENFLCKAIDNAWEHLVVGGKIAINISDVMHKKERVNICDTMNDYIDKKSDSKYYGCYGYQMMKRANSGFVKDKEGTFAEPIWIWEKCE